MGGALRQCGRLLLGNRVIFTLITGRFSYYLASKYKYLFGKCKYCSRYPANIGP